MKQDKHNYSCNYTTHTVVKNLDEDIALVYYAINVRNANRSQQLALESRNAQFFMNVYFNTFNLGNSPMLWKEIHGTKEWSTFDEWWEKNGPDSNIANYSKWVELQAAFEMYGVMAKRGFIDISVIDDMMSGTIMMYWEVSEPIIRGMRKMNYPQFQEHFEYLYEEVKKIVTQQHPEYKGINT